ncbi:hypothetical protein UP10_36325 [Bradyrhizobium sp. LTSPM299]|nr:hypothetical protein UP10_36325 [Bradyrhizobium sp. LTSPM299]
MRLHLVHLEQSFKIIIGAHAIVMVRRIECGRPYARTSTLFCESFGSGTLVYSNTLRSHGMEVPRR